VHPYCGSPTAVNRELTAQVSPLSVMCVGTALHISSEIFIISGAALTSCTVFSTYTVAT